MFFQFIKILLILPLLFAGLDSESQEPVKTVKTIEIKRGDIIVKPNHNWLPGTSQVENGNGFGHVAIVLKGSKGSDPIELLSKIELFESQARNVPPDYEIRKSKGFEPGNDYRFANISFSNLYLGNRYILRPDISEDDVEKVIEYILAQDDDYSSWRALKNTSNSSKNKNYWYCSLLIYQAFKDALNIDLDSNNGVIVFPNDIINHPMFDKPNSKFRF